MELEQESQINQPSFLNAVQEDQYPRLTERLTDMGQIHRMVAQMRSSKSVEEKIMDLKILLETPSQILYKFFQSPGLRTIGEWIYECSDELSLNGEVISKIIELLNNLQLNSDHLNSAQHLGLGIEKIQIAQETTHIDSMENVFNIFYKFYNVNKQTITTWLEGFKKRLADPNFKRQYLSSEQTSRLNNKRPHFTKDVSQKGVSPQTNFQKLIDNKVIFKTTGAGRFQRGDSPITQKKLKNQNGQISAISTTPSNNTQSKKFRNEISIKHFRKEDEAIVGDMTEQEVAAYVEECAKAKELNNKLCFNAQDMRQRETKLEKDNRNQAKESERKERERLDAMAPDSNWSIPYQISGISYDFKQNLSQYSLEKEKHSRRIQNRPQIVYSADQEIPLSPSYNNIINDQISEAEPTEILLNKLDKEDFIQILEMAINKGKQTDKPGEKRILKGILKKGKEEKERLRKKLLEEKKKQAEDEERMKKNIDPKILNLLIQWFKSNQKHSKEDLAQTMKNLGLSEEELSNIYQNINLIKRVQLNFNGSQIPNDLSLKDNLSQSIPFQFDSTSNNSILPAHKLGQFSSQIKNTSDQLQQNQQQQIQTLQSIEQQQKNLQRNQISHNMIPQNFDSRKSIRSPSINNHQKGNNLYLSQGNNSPQGQFKQTTQVFTSQKQNYQQSIQQYATSQIKQVISNQTLNSQNGQFNKSQAQQLDEVSIHHLHNKGKQTRPPGPQDYDRNIPCRMFHSEMGCKRHICHFQHINEYAGRPPPNMHKQVKPMHALSRNPERNLENTFDYNRAKFEKRSNQLDILPFPTMAQTSQTYSQASPHLQQSASLTQTFNLQQNIYSHHQGSGVQKGVQRK